MRLIYWISIALLLFLLLLPSSSPRSLEKRIRSLEANVSNLKHEVDDLLAYFKTCNNSINETVFHGFVSNYLQNKTLASADGTNNNSSDTSILQKLKQKVKNLLNFSKSSSFDDSLRVSRSNGDDADIDAGGCTDLRQHLVKFVNCLDESDRNETVIEVVQEEITTTIESTTQQSQKEREDAAEKSKVDTALSFMGHLKHPVETIGKPQFKRPDLNKVQEQIDSAKSAAWMQVEEMETTTRAPIFHFTADPFEFFDLPNIAVIKRDAKHRDLFKGLLNEPVNDPVQYDVPNEIVRGQHADDENTIISNEVNKLASKINLNQQMELISFHEGLGEKPKRFDFDVEPFYQNALQNITRFGSTPRETPEEEEKILLGAHKFFDFDADKRKRSSKDGRVERLKQDLISEYKDQHFEAKNFEKMVKQVHGDHVDRNEYKFLDETYRLNDGSTHADEIIKPLNVVSKLKSPNEITMEIELGEKFKELESYESDRKESKEAPNAPFYKSENVDSEGDLEEISP